jgi:hypothetical protein
MDLDDVNCRRSTSTLAVVGVSALLPVAAGAAGFGARIHGVTRARQLQCNVQK